MKVAVTGASGFLGGYLVEELARRGHEVVCIVRKTSDTRLLEALGGQIRHADLSDPKSLKDATKGVDAICHLAAYYTFNGKKEIYHSINVKGTHTLIEAALENGVKRFLYCSSTEATGPVEELPGTEEDKPNPQYDYGKSKLAAEEVVRKHAKMGLDYTIIRPSGIYGPRNINDVSYWMITSFAKNSIATLFIVGSGDNLVQFVHVKDVAKAFALALESGDASIHQTYIVSDEKAYSYNQVYGMLAELSGRKAPKLHLPKLLAKLLIAPIQAVNKVIGNYNFLYNASTIEAVSVDRAYSIEKIKSELGFKPDYGLHSGLEEAINWYKDNGHI